MSDEETVVETPEVNATEPAVEETPVSEVPAAESAE